MRMLWKKAVRPSPEDTPLCSMRNILRVVVARYRFGERRFGHGFRQEIQSREVKKSSADMVNLRWNKLKKVERKELTKCVGNTVGNNVNR